MGGVHWEIFTSFLCDPAARGLTVGTNTALSPHFLLSVRAGFPTRSISVTPNVNITTDEDDDMEELFREIVTSPCTAQYETAESRKYLLRVRRQEWWTMVETKLALGLEICSERGAQVQGREGKEAESHANSIDGATPLWNGRMR